MDYIQAGFDSFLSRSVDNLVQTNLDSQGPQSTQMRYDSAQTSGMLGDRLQIGNILLNGAEGNITMPDENNNRFLLGKQVGGF